jgi:D-alanyl-D-alanine carboxypeptidase
MRGVALRSALAVAVASTAAVAALVAAGPARAATPGGTTVATPAGTASPAVPAGSGSALDRAVGRLVGNKDGPPGVIVVVDRYGRIAVHTGGTSSPGSSVPIAATDHLRLASVSKAYSGAVALSLVSKRVLSLRSTVGRWLPTLPHQWSAVTLGELLQHTSGIPDFSQTKGFAQALKASPLTAPAPQTLLTYVTDPKLLFHPGSDYHYSNSDNIIVALMAQAATGMSYGQELASVVFGPLSLAGTSLPVGAAMPTPFAAGYDLDPPQPPTDVTSLFAAGWSWASGGIVATPLDATTFIRAYARGAMTNPTTRAAQFRFRTGSSEPPGPGVNSAGLGIFRYRTRCGTVYGHTGNTPGYTQFVAATADGTRSVTVSVNAQITPKVNGGAFEALRAVFAQGVCAAFGR